MAHPDLLSGLGGDTVQELKRQLDERRKKALQGNQPDDGTQQGFATSPLAMLYRQGSFIPGRIG